MMLPPLLDITSCMKSPAATSVSLFARATCFPDSRALQVGTRPEKPEMAATTVSVSSRVAARETPSTPSRTSTPVSSRRTSSAAAASSTATRPGRYLSICWRSNRLLRPAVRAATPKSLRVEIDKTEGALADGPGRTQNGETFHDCPN